MNRVNPCGPVVEVYMQVPSPDPALHLGKDLVTFESPVSRRPIKLRLFDFCIATYILASICYSGLHNIAVKSRPCTTKNYANVTRPSRGYLGLEKRLARTVEP